MLGRRIGAGAAPVLASRVCSLVTSHARASFFFRNGAAFHSSGLDPRVGQRPWLGPKGSGARPPEDCRGGGARGGRGRSQRFRTRPERGIDSGVRPPGAPAFASERWIISLKIDGFSLENDGHSLEKRWVLALKTRATRFKNDGYSLLKRWTITSQR